jgi:hypothetical protein
MSDGSESQRPRLEFARNEGRYERLSRLCGPRDLCLLCKLVGLTHAVPARSSMARDPTNIRNQTYQRYNLWRWERSPSHLAGNNPCVKSFSPCSEHSVRSVSCWRSIRPGTFDPTRPRQSPECRCWSSGRHSRRRPCKCRLRPTLRKCNSGVNLRHLWNRFEPLLRRLSRVIRQCRPPNTPSHPARPTWNGNSPDLLV